MAEQAPTKEKDLAELLLGLGEGGTEASAAAKQQIPHHCHAITEEKPQPASPGLNVDAEKPHQQHIEPQEKIEEANESGTPMVVDYHQSAAEDDEEDECELEIKEEDEEEEEEERKQDSSPPSHDDSVPSSPTRHKIDFLLNQPHPAESAIRKKRRVEDGEEESIVPSSRYFLRGYSAARAEEEKREYEEDFHHERPTSKRKYEELEDQLNPAKILASLASIGAERVTQKHPSEHEGAHAVLHKLPPLRNRKHPAEELGGEGRFQLPGPSALLHPAHTPTNISQTSVPRPSRPLPEKLKPLRLQERLAKQQQMQLAPPPPTEIEPPSHDNYYETPAFDQPLHYRQHAHLDVEDQLMMRKRRKRATADQVAFLEASFAENPLPDTETKNRIAQHLGMTTRRVTIWYQNKRARIKREMKKRRVAGNTTGNTSQQPIPSQPDVLSPPQRLSSPDIEEIELPGSPPPQQHDDEDEVLHEGSSVAVEPSSALRPFLQRKAKQHAKVRR